jgi:hypothetical protein
MLLSIHLLQHLLVLLVLLEVRLVVGVGVVDRRLGSLTILSLLVLIHLMWTNVSSEVPLVLGLLLLKGLAVVI